MGTPKEWLRLGDEYLLQRVVRIVSEVVSPVVAAGRAGQALPPLPAEVLRAEDRVFDQGPLAGLAAGFETLAGRCDAAFVIPCDHPLIRPGFIRKLIDLLGANRGVVPEVEGCLYPLSAVYRLNTYPRLCKMLESEMRAAREFAESCGAHCVGPKEFGDVDPDLSSLRNVNEISEYRSLQGNG